MDPIILLFVVGYSVCVFRVIYGKLPPKLSRFLSNKPSSPPDHYKIVTAYRTYEKHTKTNGYDHRPGGDADKFSAKMLQKIRDHIEKKQLLDYLQNPRIPIHQKVQVINKNEICEPSIKAGGLYKDFDFEFGANPERHRRVGGATLTGEDLSS